MFVFIICSLSVVFALSCLFLVLLLCCFLNHNYCCLALHTSFYIYSVATCRLFFFLVAKYDHFISAHFTEPILVFDLHPSMFVTVFSKLFKVNWSSLPLIKKYERYHFIRQ